MRADPALSGLTEILEGRAGAQDWERFEQSSPAVQVAVVHELKARVDRVVRSDPGAALPLSEALMRAAQNVPAERILALRGRAVALHGTGDRAGALASYREAERLSLAEGSPLETARIRRSMVDVLHMSGQAAEALECADLARQTFGAMGETRLLAQLEINVGNVFFRLDDYPAARERYEVARGLFEDLEDRVGLAFAHFNLGNLETEAYEFESAERAFRAARAAMRAENMEVVVADCDYSLAYLEFRRGHFGAAIRGLEAARRVYAVDGKPGGVPSCDLDLAEIYVQLDLRRDALEHARRAADAFEQLELHYESARARILAAVSSYRLGERDAARTDLDLAQHVAGRLGNARLSAFIELQRCGMDMEGEQGPSTLARLRGAWSTLDAGGQGFLADVASLILARGLIASGEAEEAAERLQALAEEVRGSGPLERTLGPEIFRTLADAYFEQEREEDAAEALRSAISAIEAAYVHVPGTDARMAFFRRPHEAFVELARLSGDAAAEDASEALSLLERSRARSSPLGEPRRLEWDVELSRARGRLDSLLGARLDVELGTTSGERQESPPSDEALVEAERELARLARRRALDPGAAPGSFDGAQVLPGALAEDEVLLAYVLTDRGASVLVVRSGRVRSVPLRVDRERIRALSLRLAFQIRKFRMGEAYVERHRASLRASTDQILGTLGEALLAPVRSCIGEHPLVVVPYGSLHNLPFHALHLDGVPLVQRNEVSYAPSVRQLERCRRPGAGTRSLLLTGAQEASAPAILRELRGLEELFGEHADRIEPSQLAAHLAAGGAGGGALHIAAHGDFRPGHPVFSGVRLGETFLTVHDIRQLRLDLDLVVLSGCETGRKADIPGEEIFSPDHALLAAGVRSVVSSLWAIRDDDSAHMMQLFYRHLAAGEPVRRALASAQRELLRAGSPLWAWAPFFISGSPATRLGTGAGRSEE